MKTTEGDHEPDRVGSLKGGFNRLARDFDRALHVGRFSTLQLFLVQQARELSWTRAQQDGAAESYPFRLNLSAMARLARADRSSLHQQHAKLLVARLFIDLGDGRQIINKDFRTWVDENGQPRLSAQQVDWCQAVRRHKSGDSSHQSRSVAPSITVGSTPQSSSMSVGPTPQVGSSDPLGPPHTSAGSTLQGVMGPAHTSAGSTLQAGKSDPLGSPHGLPPLPQTPLYGTRAPASVRPDAELRVSEERRRDSEENTHGAGGDSGRTTPPLDGADDHEPFTSPTPPPPEVADRTDPTDLAELLAWVAQRVTKFWPRDESALDIAEHYVREYHAERYSPAEIRHAVVTATTNEVPPRRWPTYCRSVLQGQRSRAGRPGTSGRTDALHEPSRPALSKYQARRQALLDEWSQDAPASAEGGDDEPF